MFQLTTKRMRPGPYATFADLPVELTTRIVALAIKANLKGARQTYLSLVRVSPRTQAVAHAVCLSQFPIMLCTRSSVSSFHALLESHPNAGSSVRNLWLVPNISSSEEQEIGGAVLFACPQLERLACNVNLLKVLTQRPPPFLHDRLRDLTIISNAAPLKELLAHPFGPTLFAQLTHLRLSGERFLNIRSFCFKSLTHYSFSHRSDCYAIEFDSTQFPVLRHIVPTIPYTLCRSENPRELRADAREEDERVELIPCPKKWKESKVWEMAGEWGRSGIWVRAASGSDVYQSRDDIVRREKLYAQWVKDPFDDEEWASILNAMEA
jgi:hypothetical protein